MKKAISDKDFERAVSLREREVEIREEVERTRTAREFRVHLCLKPGGTRGNPSGYRVIRLSYKDNVDPSLNIIVQGCQIRSRQFGWRLKSFAQENIRREPVE